MVGFAELRENNEGGWQGKSSGIFDGIWGGRKEKNLLTEADDIEEKQSSEIFVNV